MEGDVTKAERAHHRERPIEAGEPRVLLALVHHYRVEDDRVNPNHHAYKREILHQRAHVAANRMVAEEIGKLSADELQLSTEILNFTGRGNRSILSIIARIRTSTPFDTASSRIENPIVKYLIELALPELS